MNTTKNPEMPAAVRELFAKVGLTEEDWRAQGCPGLAEEAARAAREQGTVTKPDPAALSKLFEQCGITPEDFAAAKAAGLV
jgi:hypothetical protein